MTDHPVIDKHANLRQADWRFLLPSPAGGLFQHLVLLGGPPGLAERLVEVGFARRVSCDIPRARTADSVVVLHNAQVALKDAAGCLVSGGALYYEIDRRSPSKLALTPGRVKQSLRDVGLTPREVYWIIPNFTNCRRYLPLDVPAALRWYLTTLFPAMTPLDRLFEIGIRTLTGFNCDRLAPLVPCYSVTAIAGPTRDAVPSVLAHPARIMELQRPGLVPFVLTSGYDVGSRVVMLPFARDSIQPIAVLKISRLSDFNTNTEREQETLAILRARLDANMRQTIPRPLGVLRYGELAVGIESYAPGHSLVVSSGRWGVPIHRKIDDLRITANWLSEFHRQAEISRVRWNDLEIRKWVEAPVAAYTRAFGRRANEERLFTELRERAGSLVGTSLPIVWQHNDFGPWNLYRAGREFTVIDWEFGHGRERDRYGPALCDLLYFVTHWSYFAHRLHSQAAQLRAFRDLFFQPRHAGIGAKAIHEVIAEYMARLDINPEFLPLLLVYTWLDRALDHLDRQRVSGEVGVDARLGNRYVDYIGIIAEHSDWLFATKGPELASAGQSKF
jgi:phosphotransferase family enzyme